MGFYWDKTLKGPVEAKLREFAGIMTAEPAPAPPRAEVTGQLKKQEPGVAAQTGSPGAGVVREMRVEGIQRIDPETVRFKLKIKVGDPFDPERIDRSLKVLFATGLFRDVSFRREGDVLILRVEENPIISRLAFEGNDR